SHIQCSKSFFSSSYSFKSSKYATCSPCPNRKSSSTVPPNSSSLSNSSIVAPKKSVVFIIFIFVSSYFFYYVIVIQIRVSDSLIHYRLQISESNSQIHLPILLVFFLLCSPCTYAY